MSKWDCESERTRTASRDWLRECDNDSENDDVATPLQRGRESENEKDSARGEWARESESTRDEWEWEII